MAEHLTALDATFLELEQADESAHMHIGAIMVFEPSAAGGAPDHAEFCRLLGTRLGALPRYRQRLSQPRTGGMHWPEWQEDPGFDVRRHIGRAALPAPGGERELAEWSSAFFSQRLDRHRPLWEMTIVEGLQGGRWALASKTHHCMVDGVGSVDVGHLLLDAAADPPAAPAAEEPPAPAREAPAARSAQSGGRRGLAGPLERLARVWEGIVPTESIAETARKSAHGLAHPKESLFNAREAVAMILRDEVNAAPPTSLNEPMGGLRRFEVLSLPFEQLRETKNGLGGTINDAVLTICASGARALLASRGEELPEPGLRAMVPMNIRLASERLALGNKVSSLFVDLPVAPDDLIERYEETSRRSAALKGAGGAAAGASTVIELAGLAPPVLHATIAQALYAKRLFNLTITNVPGPQATLYAHGCALREIRPLVPLAAEHALGVAIVSYDGNVCLGVVAEPDAVPDLDVMLQAMRESAAELHAAARERLGEVSSPPAGKARRGAGASRARASRAGTSSTPRGASSRRGRAAP